MMPSIETYVLDACALLRLAQDEDGAETIADMMAEAQQGKCRLLMHIINLGEAVYHIAKQFGWETASQKRAEISLLPITIVPFTEETFWHAVKLKAEHAVSYADCFAAALAMQEGATLLMSDPDLEALGDKVARIKV